MALDLSLFIRNKIISSLLADAPVVAVFGTRIYDFVPDKKVYPFFRYGVDITSNGDATGGVEGGLTRVTLHVFDMGVGRENVSRHMTLVDAVVKRLDGPLDQGYLVSFEWVQNQVLGDGSQKAWHGVMEYDAWAAVDA